MADLQAKITACESIISYTFENKELCGEALTTCPIIAEVEGRWCKFGRNDRIAVFGDAIADSYLCRIWFKTGLEKGQWNNIRQAVLCDRNHDQVGRRHGLDRCVVTNPGTPTVSPKTMATTMEAILGAVYLDGGEAVLGKVMAALGLSHELLGNTF